MKSFILALLVVPVLAFSGFRKSLNMNNVSTQVGNFQNAGKKIAALAVDQNGQWVIVTKSGGRYLSNLNYFDQKKNFRSKLKELIVDKKRKIEAIGFTSGGNYVIVTNIGAYYSSLQGFKNIGFFQKLQKIKKDWGKSVKTIAFGPHNMWAIVTTDGHAYLNMDSKVRTNPEIKNSGLLQLTNELNQTKRKVSSLAFRVTKTGKLNYIVTSGPRVYSYPRNDTANNQAHALFKNKHFSNIDLVAMTPTNGHILISESNYLPLSKAENLQRSLITGWKDCDDEGKNCKPIYGNVWDRMLHHKVAGMQIAFINGNKIEEIKTYGYRHWERSHNMLKSSRFSAASLSKFLTAAGYLKAWEQDGLTLEGSNSFGSVRSFALNHPGSQFNKWHSKLKGSQVNRAKRAHIGDLLSNTAGTSIHGIGLYYTKDMPSLANIIRGKGKAKNKKVEFFKKPMHQYDYSGGGFAIAQAILELETGTKYHDYMQEKVLTPLKMYQSSFRRLTEHTRNNDLAHGHNKSRGTYSYRECPVDTAGGLYTTAADYAKYALMFANEGMIYPNYNKEYLAKDRVVKALSPRYLLGSTMDTCSKNSDCKSDGEVCYKKQNSSVKACQKMSFYGYGVSLSQNRDSNNLPLRFSHNGAQDGYRAYFKMLPSQNKGIVILVNTQSYTNNAETTGAAVLINEIVRRFDRLY